MKFILMASTGEYKAERGWTSDAHEALVFDLRDASRVMRLCPDLALLRIDELTHGADWAEALGAAA